MRICICTTPIRPVPTTFPPFGSMDIIQALRKIGEDVEFYNIDYFRPNHKQISAYFAENHFDMVGISAVVSTAYAYTKYLAELIRRVAPDTTIVVGGNLAASAEILLRKCDVDFCVVGDGELIIQGLVQVLYEKPWNYNRLRETKGICFLDENGRFAFTEYGAVLPGDQMQWPDYSILEVDGSLPYFISDEIETNQGSREWGGRSHQYDPKEKRRIATVPSVKGCVARCTFCHRWERGYRVRPVDQVVEHIQYLKGRYNVGFVAMADENFGSNRKVTWELASRLGEMEIIWRSGGVRVRSVDLDVLKHWKANGCTAVYYGIESGSQKMLDVMEKNTSVQMNIDALRATHEAGLFTIIQLVVGMPGETDGTIAETIEFLKEVTPCLFLDGDIPSNLISINYAQSLPGTPLYEYARQHGYVGNKLDDEEGYLLRISDTDAYKADHFVNYTGLPLLKVLMWRHWVTAEVDALFLQQSLGVSLSLVQVFGYYVRGCFRQLANKPWMLARVIALVPQSLLVDVFAKQLKKHSDSDYAKSGYFNIKPSFFVPLFLNPTTRRWFRPILAIGVAYVSADSSSKRFFSLLVGHLSWSLTRPFRLSSKLPEKSLRKEVAIPPSETALDGIDRMLPLREGR